MKVVGAVTCALAGLSCLVLLVAMMTPGWMDINVSGAKIQLSIWYMIVCFADICTTLSTFSAANNEHAADAMANMGLYEYMAESFISFLTCAIGVGIVFRTLRQQIINRGSLMTAAVLFLISAILALVLAGRMMQANNLLNSIFSSSLLSNEVSGGVKTPYSVILEFIGGALVFAAMVSSFVWACQTKPEHVPVPVVLQATGFTHVVHTTSGQQMMVPMQQGPVQNIPYSRFT